jgi:hypothetical protein
VINKLLEEYKIDFIENILKNNVKQYIYNIAIRFRYYAVWIMIRINIQMVNKEYCFGKYQLNLE